MQSISSNTSLTVTDFLSSLYVNSYIILYKIILLESIFKKAFYNYIPSELELIVERS